MGLRVVALFLTPDGHTARLGFKTYHIISAVVEAMADGDCAPLARVTELVKYILIVYYPHTAGVSQMWSSVDMAVADRGARINLEA